MKSLETKGITGENLNLEEFTEEGTFWFEKWRFKNSSIPYDYGMLINKYAPNGQEFLQFFIRHDGQKIMVRGKNHGPNHDSTWDDWNWILGTSTVPVKEDSVTLLNGWDAYESDHPKVRRIGDLISVTGQITRDGPANVKLPIMNLPSWARPRRELGVRIVTSETSNWGNCETCHCVVKTNGDVYKAGGRLFYAWSDIQFSFSL